MCSECRQNPCHPACPNAPEPKPAFICDICDEGIYNGEPYYSINGNIICESCIDSCRYIADVDDDLYEPDPMDIWKAKIESEMCKE